MQDDDLRTQGLTGDQVANRSFPAVRKGLAELEVRDWLRQVASEIDRLRRRLAVAEAATAKASEPRPMSEDELMAALGEETARVLRSAQEAAEDIRRKAEDRAAALVDEARGEATSIRDDAATVLERRTAEAEAVAAHLVADAEARATEQRADADAYATTTRADADGYRDDVRQRADADAHELVEGAKAHGRELVTEAQALRERILGDLSRRRQIAQQRVEELQDGARRVLDALAGARRNIDHATDAVAAADTADLIEGGAVAAPPIEPPAFVTGPVPVVGDDGEPTLEGEVEAPAADTPDSEVDTEVDADGAVEEPVAAAADLDLTDAPAATAVPTAATAEEPVPDAADTEPDVDVEVDLDAVAAHGGADRPEPAEVEPAADDEVALEAAADDDPGTDAPRTDGAGGPTIDLRADPDDNPDSGDAIEALFARLRATRRDDVDAARVVLGSGSNGGVAVLEPEAPAQATSPSAAADDHDDVDAGADDLAGAGAERDPVLVARDEVAAPVVTFLVRQVKRALQDDQNVLLETIRRTTNRTGTVSGGVDDLLSEHEVQLEALASAVRGPLVDVWDAVGYAGVDPSTVPDADRAAAIEELADRFARELLVPLRDRLETAVLEAVDTGASATELAERVGSHHREWKVERVEPSVVELVTATAARAVLTAAPEGAVLRWVVDGEGWADCEDNALEPTVRGCPFPTGHVAPPAHPRCRCALAVEG